jgi:predicted DNA-binding transcriptional regulator AlpA
MAEPARRRVPLPENRLWTIQEVSEFVQLPVATLYKHRSLGIGIPAFRLGKHLRYNPKDVYAWLDEHRDEP